MTTGMIVFSVLMGLVCIGVGFVCAAPQMALTIAIDALVDGIESIEEKG